MSLFWLGWRVYVSVILYVLYYYTYFWLAVLTLLLFFRWDCNFVDHLFCKVNRPRPVKRPWRHDVSTSLCRAALSAAARRPRRPVPVKNLVFPIQAKFDVVFQFLWRWRIVMHRARANSKRTFCGTFMSLRKSNVQVIRIILGMYWGKVCRLLKCSYSTEGVHDLNRNFANTITTIRQAHIY